MPPKISRLFLQVKGHNPANVSIDSLPQVWLDVVTEIRVWNKSALAGERLARNSFAFRTHLRAPSLALPHAFRNSKNGLHALKTRDTSHTFLHTHIHTQKNQIFPNQSGGTSATTGCNQINFRLTVKVTAKRNHLDCVLYSSQNSGRKETSLIILKPPPAHLRVRLAKRQRETAADQSDHKWFVFVFAKFDPTNSARIKGATTS